MPSDPGELARRIFAGEWLALLRERDSACVYPGDGGFHCVAPYLDRETPFFLRSASFGDGLPDFVQDPAGLSGVLARLLADGFKPHSMDARPLAEWSARVLRGEGLALGRKTLLKLQAGVLGGLVFAWNDSRQGFCAPVADGVRGLQRQLALWQCGYAEVVAEWSPADPDGDPFLNPARVLRWSGYGSGGSFDGSLARAPDGRYRQVFVLHNDSDPMGGSSDDTQDAWVDEAAARKTLEGALRECHLIQVAPR